MEFYYWDFQQLQLISLWMLEKLATNELLPEQSPLDKAIEEIGEKIDKVEKTCEKLMILMEKTKIWKSSSKMPSKHTWEKL